MFKKISLISLLSFLMMLLPGCSDDIINDFPGVDGDNHESAGLRINVPRTPVTRATSTPTEKEQKLTSLILFAYAYDDQDKLSKVEVRELMKDGKDATIAINDSYDTYELEDFPIGKYKFYVVANVHPGFDEATWKAYADTPENLKRELVGYEAKFLVYPQTNDYKGLPMSCDHSGMMYGPTKDDREPLPDIFEYNGGATLWADLEFCMAKVTVNVENPVGDYMDIDEAVLTGYADHFPVLKTFDPTPALKGVTKVTDKGLKPNPLTGVEGTYTFYVPENDYIEGTPSLHLKFGDKEVDIELGEKNGDERQLLRGHHYKYLVTGKGEIKLDVFRWTKETLEAEINAPFELVLLNLPDPENCSIGKLKSGEKVTFKYRSDAESLDIDVPKFGDVPFYNYAIDKGNSTITIELNNKVSLAEFNKLKNENPDKVKELLYFHVVANNLMKRVKVDDIDVEASFSLSPQTIIIDLRELIAGGYDTYRYDIQYSANFGDVVADWASVKWKNEDGTSTEYGADVRSANGTLFEVIRSAGRNGNDQVNIGLLDQGELFWNSVKTLEVTYRVQTTDPEEAEMLAKLQEKGEDVKKVYFKIIPYSSTYKIHFKAQNGGWNMPHIYVYQCLELPEDLKGTNKAYAGKTVAVNTGNTNQAALQYCFSTGFAFKGWYGYGGPADNDPNEAGTTTDKNGFFAFNNTATKYEPYTGILGQSGMNTKRYMWFGFNEAHYKNLKASGQKICTEEHCNPDFNPAFDDSEKTVKLWPGIIMRREENGWWTYELSGVAEPGKTLIMFADLHATESTTKRFPGDGNVGVPLFDYEDKEGWFLYKGGEGDDYVTNRFYDDCPDGGIGGGGGGGDIDEPNNVTIYYKVSNGKVPQNTNGDVYIRYSGGTGAMSGNNNVKMTLETIGNDRWWKYEIPADNTKLQFCSYSNSNSYQSGEYSSLQSDIQKSSNKVLYYTLNDSWQVECLNSTIANNITVTVEGGFNNWPQNAANGKKSFDAVTTQTVEIGNTEFKIVEHNNGMTWYSSGGNINLNTWTSVGNESGNMKIDKGVAGKTYTVQWNSITKQLKITDASSNARRKGVKVKKATNRKASNRK